MRKHLLSALAAVLLLSGCGTYTGQGAATGAYFGSIIGSAFGGINGGPRGHDRGTLIGMAGGAVLGAVVGAAADKKAEQRYAEHKRELYGDDGVVDPTHSGDDIIIFEGSDDAYPSSDATPSINASDLIALEITNIRFVDEDGDRQIKAGEECRVSFNIINRSQRTVHNELPIVKETSGNKRLHITESVLIGSIRPKRGIRYTAMIKAENRLKNGTATISIGVLHNNTPLDGVGTTFNIATKRK